MPKRGSKKQEIKKSKNQKKKKVVKKKVEEKKVVKRKKVSKKKTTLLRRRVRKIIPVGGMGFANGIMMRTPNFMSIAMRSEEGDIERVSFKLKRMKKKPEFLSLFFIRGIVLFIETLFLYFRILFHKRKLIKKELKREPRHKRLYIRGYQYILYFIYIILFVGFFDYMFLKLRGWPTADMDLFIYNFIFTFTYIIFFLILFALVAVSNRKELEVFAYHGAEHKIINAYEKGEKLTIDSIKKESTIHPRCGSIIAFWSLIFLAILLVLFNWKNYNFFLNFITSLGLLFISFSLSYEFVRFLVSRPKSILFKIFVKPVFLFQSIVVRNPSEEHIKIGLVAFRDVMRMESKK